MARFLKLFPGEGQYVVPTLRVLVHDLLYTWLLPSWLKCFSQYTLTLLQKWDDELADVACEHVKYCQTSEDQCRSTSSYAEPGQNTKLYSTTSSSESSTSILQRGILEWFEEYSNTRPSIVDSYIER